MTAEKPNSASVFANKFMTNQICKCCGSPFSSNGRGASPNPNLCHPCFIWPDETVERGFVEGGCPSRSNPYVSQPEHGHGDNSIFLEDEFHHVVFEVVREK